MKKQIGFLFTIILILNILIINLSTKSINAQSDEQIEIGSFILHGLYNNTDKPEWFNKILESNPELRNNLYFKDKDAGKIKISKENAESITVLFADDMIPLKYTSEELKISLSDTTGLDKLVNLKALGYGKTTDTPETNPTCLYSDCSLSGFPFSKEQIENLVSIFNNFILTKDPIELRKKLPHFDFDTIRFLMPKYDSGTGLTIQTEHIINDRECRENESKCRKYREFKNPEHGKIWGTLSNKYRYKLELLDEIAKKTVTSKEKYIFDNISDRNNYDNKLQLLINTLEKISNENTFDGSISQQDINRMYEETVAAREALDGNIIKYKEEIINSIINKINEVAQNNEKYNKPDPNTWNKFINNEKHKIITNIQAKLDTITEISTNSRDLLDAIKSEGINLANNIDFNNLPNPTPAPAIIESIEIAPINVKLPATGVK